MMSHRVAATVLSFALLAAPSAAQGTADLSSAFEHYEAIRVVLAGDGIDGIATPAAALAPLLARIGADASVKSAVTSLGAAKNIKEARAQFGIVSTGLVPKFLDAKLPGVEGYMCAMTAGPWAQRGEAIQNPYFGKVMLDCGSKIKR